VHRHAARGLSPRCRWAERREGGWGKRWGEIGCRLFLQTSPCSQLTSQLASPVQVPPSSSSGRPSGPTSGLALHPAGMLLAASGDDLLLWDLRMPLKPLLQAPSGHQGPITAMALLPPAQCQGPGQGLSGALRVVTTGRDWAGRIHTLSPAGSSSPAMPLSGQGLWPRSGHSADAVMLGHGAALSSLHVLPPAAERIHGGAAILTVSAEDGGLGLWDLSGSCLGLWQGHSSAIVASAVSARTGSLLSSEWLPACLAARLPAFPFACPLSCETPVWLNERMGCLGRAEMGEIEAHQPFWYAQCRCTRRHCRRMASRAAKQFWGSKTDAYDWPPAPTGSAAQLCASRGLLGCGYLVRGGLDWGPRWPG
jgi:hypothetical protein